MKRMKRRTGDVNQTEVWMILVAYNVLLEATTQYWIQEALVERKNGREPFALVERNNAREPFSPEVLLFTATQRIK